MTTTKALGSISGQVAGCAYRITPPAPGETIAGYPVVGWLHHPASARSSEGAINEMLTDLGVEWLDLGAPDGELPVAGYEVRDDMLVRALVPLGLVPSPYADLYAEIKAPTPEQQAASRRACGL